MNVTLNEVLAASLAVTTTWEALVCLIATRRWKADRDAFLRRMFDDEEANRHSVERHFLAMTPIWIALALIGWAWLAAELWRR